jgi:MSHA biogenesis protein MshQ
VVNGATNLTARLDSSMAPSGSFALGVADVSAPLSISRGTSADGPYAALKVGIAPVDTDGVKMLQPYDLNVGGALDHTSIMDPLVQNVTEVRYGRIKIPNAYGSARLPRPITATVQYFNGTYWQTSVMDNESSLGSILQSDVGALTHCPFASIGATSIAFGVGTISLPAPGVACSANITANGPMYLPSTTGRVTFGIYKSPLIYRRENY